MATRPAVVRPAWYFTHSRTMAIAPMPAMKMKTVPVTSSQSWCSTCPKDRAVAPTADERAWEAIRHLLSDFIELQDPVSRKDMRELLDYTQCPHTRGELEKYTPEGEAAAELFALELAPQPPPDPAPEPESDKAVVPLRKV